MGGNPIWKGEAMNKEVPMLRYQVDDMSCGHCVQAITAAVKDVDPSAEVQVDLSSKAVQVSTSVAGPVVAQAIRNAGYTPAEAPGDRVVGASCCGGRR